MTAADGRQIEVLDAGTLNLHSGPDFLGAKIRIGPKVFFGDVEFHRTEAEWSTHGHDADPRYNRVILHVVLEPCSAPAVRTACGREVPNLVLSRTLDEPSELLHRRAELEERRRKAQTIPCAELNYDVHADLLSAWLVHLATERLELKLRRFDDRLQECIRAWLGTPASDTFIPLREFRAREHWEQVLYEGLMDSLGYVRNRTPFLQLARILPLETIASLGVADTPLLVEALLFGVAGLIPEPSMLRDPSSQRYVVQIDEAWSALRHRYHGPVMHPADWSFSPTRPGNFPTARIAEAAGLIHAILRNELFYTLFRTLLINVPTPLHVQEVMRLLSAPPSPYWQSHYHFGRTSTGETVRLGESRRRAIVVNVLVPLVLCYARRFHDMQMRSRALALFNAMQASGVNFITRLMEGHLVRGKISLGRAVAEQGAIELYHFYCTRSRCGECWVGKELGLRN
jgi:hypothetical protein